MIREILTDNHPILLQKATPVAQEEFATVSELVTDLIETMRHADLVGIAAPQIGISKRIFISETLEKNEAGEKEKRTHVFINPEITYRSESQVVDYEGCGSVPDCFGPVKRSRKVTVKYANEIGEILSLTAEWLLSRVIQHEYDHLEGILFLQHIEDTSTLLTKDQLIEKYKREKEEREKKKLSTQQ